MYLHLGEETVVTGKSIIGIFDIENTSISKHTRDFLARSEKNSRIYNVSYEMPKSFIVCREKTENSDTVYISQISAATLKKRVFRQL